MISERERRRRRREDEAGAADQRVEPAILALQRGAGNQAAIAEDTRGQVATQHGITQALLEQANAMPAAPPTTPVPAGSLLLIPLR